MCGVANNKGGGVVGEEEKRRGGGGGDEEMIDYLLLMQTNISGSWNFHYDVWINQLSKIIQR